MSGFEFISNIKLISPKMKVLLMSAFEVSDDSEFDLLMRNGLIDGFIQKQELYALVDSHSQCGDLPFACQDTTRTNSSWVDVILLNKRSYTQIL